MMVDALDFALRTSTGKLLRRTLGRAWDEPVVSIGDSAAVTDRANYLIPNSLIQTWESKSFGKRHAKSIKDFRDLNPDINFKIFDAVERDSFMSAFDDKEIREIYFNSLFNPMRVDIFRYAYIHRLGGYYLDISMKWTSPITSLHVGESTGFVGFEGNASLFLPPPAAIERLRVHDKLACVWGFGFVKEHEIPINALDYVKKYARYFRGKTASHPKSAIVSLTGPVAFTNAVWQYLEKREDAGLSQQPHDFNYSGKVHVGAGYRHLQVPSYATEKDKQILS